MQDAKKENEIKKQIKAEMDYIAANKVYLFFKINESEIRFSDENAKEDGEIPFSSHAYVWTREELRTLINFMELQGVSFPHKIYTDKMEDIITPLNKPYPILLKEVAWNYKNKLFFLLKTKDGVNIPRIKLMKNQKYIVFAKVSGINLDYFCCEDYNNGIRNIKNFIPLFTSTDLAKQFQDKGKEALADYKPIVFNYKRIEKKAIAKKQNICINCTSPVLKNKDFAYVLTYEGMEELKKEQI